MDSLAVWLCGAARGGRVARVGPLVLSLATSLALGAAGVSADPGDPFDMATACRSDFHRFCAELGRNANRDEIFRCLSSHEDAVSAGCRVALGEERDADRQGSESPGETRGYGQRRDGRAPRRHH